MIDQFFRAGQKTISASWLNEVAEMNREDKRRRLLESAYSPRGKYQRRVVFSMTMKITGSTARAGKSNQWDYDADEAIADSDGDFITRSGGISTGDDLDSNANETIPKLRNRFEQNNTGAGNEGVGFDYEPDGATLTMLPIATGTYVKVDFERDEDGLLRPWMEVQNPVTVECD